jgi:hypothetical protein
LAGEATPLIDLLGALLAETRNPWIGPEHHAAVTEAASALAPLLPAATTHLTGAAAFTAPDRDRQVLAARLAWAVTGDAAAILPTVRAVLAQGSTPAHEAAGLVADLADAGVDVADVEPLLRRLLSPRHVVDGVPDDGGARVAAARALWRLGVPPAELTASLIESIQDRWTRGDPVALLVEMGAVDAAAELERLADQPRRITVAATTADDLVWSDEALQTRLRAAAATLRGDAVRQHSPSAST